MTDEQTERLIKSLEATAAALKMLLDSQLYYSHPGYLYTKLQPYSPSIPNYPPTTCDLRQNAVSNTYGVD